MSEQVPQARRRLRRRRRTTNAAPTPDPQAWRAAGIVAAIAVVVVLVGMLLPTPSAYQDPISTVEPVDSAIAVCPEPGSIGGARTTSAATVVPGLLGQDRPGEATIGYLEGDGAVEDTADGAIQGSLTAPGDTVQVVAEETRLPALEVRTAGGLAPGLVAAQTTQDSFTLGRGLASQPCLAPDTTWWFVGGGSSAGRESQLVLVNPEDTPADLEVAISGPDGPVSTPRLRGVVVEPRSRVTLQLLEEAPRLPVAAWRVTVRQGRVVAALFDKEADGFVPRGADWIPASADPSTRALIPGVSGGAGSRELVIHTPGEIAATVGVRLVTAAGAFTPEAVSKIEVPGGSVVAVPIEEALQGADATVDLQSDVPIVAGVRQRFPGIDATVGALEELSFMANAEILTSRAAVTALPADSGSRVVIWVTAPEDVISREISPDGMDPGATDEPIVEDSAEPTSESSPSPTEPTDEATGDSGADGSQSPAPADVPQGERVITPPVTVSLRVFPVSPEGTPLPTTPGISVTVPRGLLTAVTIPRPEGAAWFTVVATLSGGDAVIAHQVIRGNEDGSLFTGYPWRPLRTAVLVPQAVPDARLGLPGR